MSQSELSSGRGVEPPPGRHNPLRKSPGPTPPVTRAFARPLWGLVAWRLVMVVGALMQVIMAWVCYELVDLSLDLMEVWAELARKHLEIVLSR